MLETMSRVSAASSPSGETNEDVYGHSASAAWVIDGATGVADRRYTDAATDALWYASNLSRAISSYVDHAELTLTEVLRSSILDVSKKFDSQVKGTIPTDAVPSGAAALIRYVGRKLEYLVLGDCTILVPRGNEIISIKDDRIAVFERPILDARIRHIAERGFDTARIRQEILPMVVQCRRSMNAPHGYWICSLSPEAADQAIVGSLETQGKAPVVLLTDGLSRLIDQYRRESNHSLYWRSINNGLDGLIQDLRMIERRDPQAIKYPRLKVSDDATGLVIHPTVITT